MNIKKKMKKNNSLEGMNALDVINHDHKINVINVIWDCKCKQFPNDTVKISRACYCIHPPLQPGDGKIDFFENYTSVRWDTVLLMLILENLLDLKTKQADAFAASLHATIGEDEKV